MAADAGHLRVPPTLLSARAPDAPSCLRRPLRPLRRRLVRRQLVRLEHERDYPAILDGVQEADNTAVVRPMLRNGQLRGSPVGLVSIAQRNCIDR